MDAVGHYSRWDAVSLAVSDETLSPVVEDGARRGRPRTDGHLPAAAARDLADEYDVPVDAVEGIAEAIPNR